MSTYYFWRWNGYDFREIVMISCLALALMASAVVIYILVDCYKINKRRKKLREKQLNNYFISKDIMDKRL